MAPCFERLAGLLSSSAEFDSQLGAFGLLDALVDRLADEARPYAPALLALLPAVWQQAEGQSLLRIQVCERAVSRVRVHACVGVEGARGAPVHGSISSPSAPSSTPISSTPLALPPLQVLVTLQRLVHSLGAESPAAYPLVLPVLAACTDPAQPDELNLLEDGLQLWLVALRHAPAPHPGLLGALFPNLVAAMGRSTEHIAVSGAGERGEGPGCLAGL